MGETEGGWVEFFCIILTPFRVQTKQLSKPTADLLPSC